METWVTVIHDYAEHYVHCTLGPFETEVDAAMAGTDFCTFASNEGGSDTLGYVALPITSLEDAKKQEVGDEDGNS